MKHKFIVACSIALFAAVAQAAQLVTNFGATAENGGSWVWTPGTSTLTGTEGAGDLIFGAPLTNSFLDFSVISVTATATTAPNFGFNVVFEDSNFNTATANFNWLDFVGGNTVTSAVVIQPGFNKNNVVGWSLFSGGSAASINVVLTSITAGSAIPEPSTAAALGGMAILGFAAARRQRRSA